MNLEDASVNELIDILSKKVKPKYIPDYENFVPGKDQILYSGPFFSHEEIRAGITALCKTKWLSNGEYTARFQHAFAKKFNVKEAHFVNSGSSANLCMIAGLKKALGWKDGDRVIVSPVGFPTTVAPLIQNGLVPVFVDIELDTLNFDIDKIEEYLNNNFQGNKLVVAIFVSPVLGNPPDLDRLQHICDASGIKLIGDNCDSLGSRWNGKLITDYYYAWSTSFYPAHHISTGEGGMVCSNDERVILEARSFSWWGRDCHCVGAANLLPCGTCGNRFDTHLGKEFGIVDHKYVFTNIGYNLKPLDLQAAIGLEQLNKFDRMEALRRHHFDQFSRLLRFYIKDIDIAWNLPEADPSWFGVPIICSSMELKTKLVAFLESHKIQTRNYFAGNLLCHPAYKHLGDYKKFPNANAALTHVFFVGCPPHYNDKVFDYIESVLKQWK